MTPRLDSAPNAQRDPLPERRGVPNTRRRSEKVLRRISHAPDVAPTNLGFGILDVFVKVRPEKPKPGS